MGGRVPPVDTPADARPALLAVMHRGDGDTMAAPEGLHSICLTGHWLLRARMNIYWTSGLFGTGIALSGLAAAAQPVITGAELVYVTQLLVE